MFSIASADQQYDWPWEQRNEAPNNMTYVYYDFEEGFSFSRFNNLHPEVCECFL